MSRSLVLPFALLAAALFAGCDPAPTVDDPPEACGPGNCNGCCDAAGACVAGDGPAGCGTGGNLCDVCTDTETCHEAVCTAQETPDYCPPSGDGIAGPRSDFAAAYDPVGKELIVFGGDPGVPVNCQARPEFNGETWFYSPSCGTWRQGTMNGPPARSRTVGVFDSKRRRFVVFGGRFRAGTSGAYTVYNETWQLMLTPDPAVHIWEPITPTGPLPPPLSSAAGVYDPEGDRLIVYGGNQSSNGAVFTPEGRVFALNFADDTWEELVPSSASRPPARLFHALALDAQRNQLVMFGGGDANAFLGPFLRDTWTFDLTTRTWSELTQTGEPPMGRIRPAMVADPERDRMLLFGGHDDGQLGERNDLWALNLSSGTWQLLREGDTFKTAGSGFCDFPADFTTPDLSSPERREAVGLVHVPALGHLLFGGRSDCGVLNDVWKLHSEHAEWEELQTSFTGLSCERSGKQGCTKLCF